jgi:hypothetical protein
MAPLRILQSALLAAVLCSGAPCARADIYTWVDASGTTNISNIAPPEGTRVTSVLKSSSVKPADSDAGRDEVIRNLADRVRQLQNEVEASRRAPPVPAAYPYGVPPPQAQYVADAMPPPVQYSEFGSAPSQDMGCDSMYQYCGPVWGFVGVPAVIAWTAPYVRHFHGARGSPRGFAPRPGHMHGGARRR